MGTPFGFRRIRKIGTALILALLVVAPTTPSLAGSKHAPLGYQLMCLKNPQECKGGGASKVPATEALMATLKRVNGQVNRSIRPRNEAGGADVWTASASVGDCEDYVMAKRRALIKSGVPSSALRIAYVKTRQGEGHAILVVKTNGQNLVLDNLTGAIRPLSQTGYRIVSMSGANPRNWS